VVGLHYRRFASRRRWFDSHFWAGAPRK